MEQTLSENDFLISTFENPIIDPSLLKNHVFFSECRLETIDGSAVEEEDYRPLNETLTFEPNERTKEVINST